MKLLNAYRSLLSVAAMLIMLTMITIDPAYAQSDNNDTNRTPAQVQYSADELELMRSKLLELLDTVKDLSETVTPGDVQTADNLARARKQIEQFSASELNALRATMDPSKMNVGLDGARTTLNEFKPALQAFHDRGKASKADGYIPTSVGLPPVEGPDAVCEALVGAGRPTSELVIATEAVYMTAKIVDVALNRACNQVAVAVILGAGGAGSSTGQANLFIAKGDTARDAGNYKAAYQAYRSAYKAAAR